MNTRRRWLAAGAAIPTLAWTGALRAQAKPPVVIGWLAAGSADESRRRLDAFNEGMAALGRRVGTEYRVETRVADGRSERLPALAQELAAMKPAVIVAMPSASVRAAAKAAPNTPVVRADGDSPLAGLVNSLARPGGMVTGVSSFADESSAKAVELMVEAVPRLRRIGFLADTTSGGIAENVHNARQTAERLRFDAVVINVATPDDIDPVLTRFASEKVQALVILPHTFLSASVPKILQRAMTQRWPVVGAVSARQGALLYYGPDRLALARRAASYVDRILKGAKPGDLPIEQPTNFELIVNLKVASSLGFVMPRSIMLRATEVIE